MSRYEFRLPDIGEGLAEAEVARWLVAVGDHVVEDQPVVEMMTDKAAVELPAPAEGVIVERRAAEGDVVRTGAVLYVLETEARMGGNQAHATALRAAPAAPAGPSAVLAPPAVRKLARELNVDLARVTGSGPQGRITAEDVNRYAAGANAAPADALPVIGGGARAPLRGVQRRMAETMSLSARTIAHVTGFHELDAADFVGLVGRLRKQAEARGRRFPFDAMLVRAASIALSRHPIFNASLDAERGELVLHPEANIGVATATPEGLIVPVVHDAGGRDLDDLAAEVDRIMSAARDGKVAPADLRGGTFTISNTGAWRGGFGTSLIRPPEVAIVAFGRIVEKAVVHDGSIVARPVMPMSVTFDHRVIDGANGLTFALTLRDLIENPDGLVPGSGARRSHRPE